VFFNLVLLVEAGTHINDANIVSLLDEIPQHVSQVEMAKMINPHLELKPILGQSPLRHSHNSRIIDQNIDFFKLALDHISKLLNRHFTTQIKLMKLNVIVMAVVADISDGLVAFKVVASCDDYSAALFGEGKGCLSADAGVAARDDGHLPAQLTAEAAGAPREIGFYEGESEEGAGCDEIFGGVIHVKVIIS
jgi:hypothetical protein